MALEFNAENFFRELYFCPSKTDDYYTSLALSVALAVFSLGIVPVTVGICWIAKPTFVWIKEIIESTMQKTSEVAKPILQQEETPQIEPSQEDLFKKEFSEKLTELFKSAPVYSSDQKMRPKTMDKSIMRTTIDGTPCLVLKVTYANPEDHYEKHILPEEDKFKMPDGQVPFKEEMLKKQFLIGIQQKTKSSIVMDTREIENPPYRYEHGSQPFYNHRSYPYYFDNENWESNQQVSAFFFSLLKEGVAKDHGGNEWKLV